MSEMLITTLKNNELAVIATDTIYGVVGRADSEAVVRRLYELKGRDEVKPFIILIPAIDSLEQFGIELDGAARELLGRVWPGAVTVILPVQEREQARLEYLHRGTNSLAFRMPAKASLIELLHVTGPLVAPSANPQGLQPATTIAEAKEYFGSAVAHYEDEGIVQGQPSTIISIDHGVVTILRQGSVAIDKI